MFINSCFSCAVLARKKIDFKAGFKALLSKNLVFFAFSALGALPKSPRQKNAIGFKAAQARRIPRKMRYAERVSILGGLIGSFPKVGKTA